MFILEVFKELPLISENFLYRPRAAKSASGKSYGYLYKDPVVADYQEKIATEFKSTFMDGSLPPKDMVCSIISFYVFGVHPDRFFSRDLTNMIKATEDAIFSALPYDDSMVTCILERKIPSDTDFVFVKIGIITSVEDSDIDLAIQLANSERWNDYFIGKRGGTDGWEHG
jgi:Holliday junction resolvase RusA-like endonuclease